MKKLERNVVEDLRDSLLFEVPLYVRNRQGEYVERYGHLGIEGFYFETEETPLPGQVVGVRIVLLGLGREIETQGRVARVVPGNGHVRVSVRFEDIPFDVERTIARWLDMLTRAHRMVLAAG